MKWNLFSFLTENRKKQEADIIKKQETFFKGYMKYLEKEGDEEKAIDAMLESESIHETLESISPKFAEIRKSFRNVPWGDYKNKQLQQSYTPEYILKQAKELYGEYKDNYTVAKELHFDADSQGALKVPVYFNPSLINYYVVRTMDSYSWLAAMNVIDPLSRAIDWITKEVMKCKMGLYYKRDDAQDTLLDKGDPIDISELENDPLLSFFNSTDETMDFEQFLKIYIMYYLIDGNVYLMPRNPVTSAGGKLEGYQQLVPLAPMYVTAELNLSNQIAFFRYRPGLAHAVDIGQADLPSNWEANVPESMKQKDIGLYTEFIIPPQNIIYVHAQPNPLLPTAYGSGIVELHEKLFQKYLIVFNMESHFVENAMSPAGVLSIDANAVPAGEAFDEDLLERYLNKMERAVRGKFKTGKTPILPQGVHYTETRGYPDPENIVKIRQNVEHQILQLFHLPPQTFSDGGVNLKYDNLYELTQEAREKVVTPILESLKIACNKFLKMNGKKELVWDYVNTSLWTPDRVIKGLAGHTLTTNDAMKLLNLPQSDEDNADEHIWSISSSTLSKIGIKATEQVANAGNYESTDDTEPNDLPKPKANGRPAKDKEEVMVESNVEKSLPDKPKNPDNAKNIEVGLKAPENVITDPTLSGVGKDTAIGPDVQIHLEEKDEKWRNNKTKDMCKEDAISTLKTASYTKIESDVRKMVVSDDDKERIIKERKEAYDVVEEAALKNIAYIKVNKE